ncbi:hypothetical protein H257_09146 [Aphanomyces astaci]|uniref:Anaphase-promoting complex subunit 10 n=1 Tax=Aphanomyces astaci TaxID=112090 RepID=W4GC74_APHAT|nr:hypothetical protein H257_09146 [Aphanomyces astaci]ETV76659.1 hypothetical protein H257_09146 [Aphanomyces astaci]|eukprot:XP_009833572.1 hypothetical protein H257_09146 [Aphanomyces astaci]
MEKREIGDEAVWTLSSAKQGNGVQQLRDDNLDTYWQSDGAQPHLINIQFHKKTTVQEVALYLDYKLDESYTPKTITVRTGTTFHDLVDVLTHTTTEPTGWVTIPLSCQPTDLSMLSEQPLRTFFLQLAVTGMHQNGRDTHIRQVKVFAPRQPQRPTAGTFHFRASSSVEVSSFACIR